MKIRINRLWMWTIVFATPLWPAESPVTFTNDVERLLQKHCQLCHHPGGLAPFSLMTYEDALPLARAMYSAVKSRRMPEGATMRLNTGCCSTDTFEGVRRLTDEEIDVVARWVEAGAPRGDQADAPAQLIFNDSPWKAGPPDLIIPNTPGGFLVPPHLGRDVFRRFPIPPQLAQDRYLTSFEALPGSGDDHEDHMNRTVHHVTLFIDPECGSFAQERAFMSGGPELLGAGFEGEFTYPTSLVGMWFPGSDPLHLADGIGIKLPAMACMVMEVHYATYHDEAVLDQTMIGLRFATAPVEKERLAVLVKNVTFTIPAGEERYTVPASLTLSQPVTLYSITPHMHQLGTDFRMEAVLPDGEKICLGDVQWDFRHQNTHNYKKPISLPAGTEVRSTCVYDNTANNPNQIHAPPIDVPFGTVSDREMCQLTLGLTVEGGNKALK